MEIVCLPFPFFKSTSSSLSLTLYTSLFPVESFFLYLKSLSPSATDLEIRSSLGTSLEHLNLFIHALTQRLKSHRDFEAVEAFISVFLKIHGEVLIQNGEELRDSLEHLRRAQVKEGGRLAELCGFSRESWFFCLFFLAG